MHQEACPHCKSTNTERFEIGNQIYWRCNHQGCDGKIAADRAFWKQGAGLPIDPETGKPAKPAKPAPSATA